MGAEIEFVMLEKNIGLTFPIDQNGLLPPTKRIHRTQWSLFMVRIRDNFHLNFNISI